MCPVPRLQCLGRVKVWPDKCFISVWWCPWYGYRVIPRGTAAVWHLSGWYQVHCPSQLQHQVMQFLGSSPLAAFHHNLIRSFSHKSRKMVSYSVLGQYFNQPRRKASTERCLQSRYCIITNTKFACETVQRSAKSTNKHTHLWSNISWADFFHVRPKPMTIHNTVCTI